MESRRRRNRSEAPKIPGWEPRSSPHVPSFPVSAVGSPGRPCRDLSSAHGETEAQREDGYCSLWGVWEGAGPPPHSCPRADQAAPTSLKSQGRGCGGLWWFGWGAGPRWGGSQLGTQWPVQMEKDGLPGAGAQEYSGKQASGSTGPRPHWGERGARWALGTLLSGSRYDSQTGPRTLQTHTFKSTQTLSQRSAGSRARF